MTIDQDIAGRQTAADRAALALFSQRYPCTGAREQLIARLERYQAERENDES